MFKQIFFFRKRPDMSTADCMDYYENQHSQLGKRIGEPGIPNALFMESARKLSLNSNDYLW